MGIHSAGRWPDPWRARVCHSIRQSTELSLIENQDPPREGETPPRNTVFLKERETTERNKPSDFDFHAEIVLHLENVPSPVTHSKSAWTPTKTRIATASQNPDGTPLRFPCASDPSDHGKAGIAAEKGTLRPSAGDARAPWNEAPW